MKLYKKIDLFFEGKYLCSTMQSKTCKEAKKKYLDNIGKFETTSLTKHLNIKNNAKSLKAFFDKSKVN